MKKVVSGVAVAMLLCAGSAFALPAGQINGTIKTPGGIQGNISADNKSVMKNVTNTTKIDNSNVMNMGDGNMDVGVVANSAGGEMDTITNKTEITNGSNVMNMGDGYMRVGTVQN